MRTQTEIEYQQKKTRRKRISALFSLLITAGLCALVLVFAWYFVVPAALLFGLIFYAITSRSPSPPDTISASDGSFENTRGVEDVPLLDGTRNERSVTAVPGQSPNHSTTHDEEESVGASSGSDDEEEAPKPTPSQSTSSSTMPSRPRPKNPQPSTKILKASQITTEVKKEATPQEKKEGQEIYAAKGAIHHQMRKIFSPNYELQDKQWKILEELIDKIMQVEAMSHQEKLKFIGKVEEKCKNISYQTKDGKEAIEGFGFIVGADYKQQAFRDYLDTLQEDLNKATKANTFEYSPSKPDASELEIVKQKIWDIFKWIAKKKDKVKIIHDSTGLVEGGLDDLLYEGTRGDNARTTEEDKLEFVKSIHEEVESLLQMRSVQEQWEELTLIVGTRLAVEKFVSPGFNNVLLNERIAAKIAERVNHYKKPVPSSPENPLASSDESDTPQVPDDVTSEEKPSKSIDDEMQEIQSLITDIGETYQEQFKDFLKTVQACTLNFDEDNKRSFLASIKETLQEVSDMPAGEEKSDNVRSLIAEMKQMRQEQLEVHEWLTGIQCVVDIIFHPGGTTVEKKQAWDQLKGLINNYLDDENETHQTRLSFLKEVRKEVKTIQQDNNHDRETRIKKFEEYCRDFHSLKADRTQQAAAQSKGSGMGKHPAVFVGAPQSQKMPTPLADPASAESPKQKK